MCARPTSISTVGDGEAARRIGTRGTLAIELVVIASPYRSVLRPLVEYVENLRRDAPGELVTVVVPEIVPRRWWEHFLHNKTALYIRTAFLFKPNVVVTAVPFHLGTPRGCATASTTMSSWTSRSMRMCA